jgi:autotransporter-associated beta strand protein
MNTRNKHIQCAHIVRLLAVGAIMAATARGEDYYWTGTTVNPDTVGNWRLGSAGGAAATILPGSGDNIFLTASGSTKFNVTTATGPKTWNNVTAEATKFTVEIRKALTLTGTLFANTGMTTSVYGTSALTINTLQMDGGVFQANNGAAQAVGSLGIGTINFNAGAIHIAVSPVATGANGAVITSAYSLGKINIGGNAGANARQLYLANHNGTGANGLILNSTAFTTGIEDAPDTVGGTRIVAASTALNTNRATLVIDVDGLSSYETQARLEDTLPTSPGKGILTVRKTGAGTQVLSGTNSSYTGGTELVSGTLGVGHSKALGTGTLTVMAGATLPALAFYADNINLVVPLFLGSDVMIDSRAFTGTLTGALTGTAAIIKTGVGSLVFAGDAAQYTGAVTIQTGVIKLTGAGNLDNSPSISIASGATLEGALSRTAGRSLAGTGTLAGNLTLNGGSLLFDTTGPAFDPLSITGTLAFASGGNSNIELGTLATGTFHLVTAGTISGAAADYTILSHGAQITARNDYQFIASGTEMILDNKVVSLDLTWTGSDGAGAAWAASGTAAANWTSGGAVKETHFATGDAVTFAGGTIAVDAAGVTASEMRVQGSGPHVFNGGVITASGASALAGSALTGTSGKLLKTGAGVLVFQNSANTFTGGIETSGGVIAFDNGSQLGDGGNGILFSDDAALRADADALLLSNHIKIAGGKTAAIDTQGNTLSYSGTLSLTGASGTFAKTGAGLLLLTADSAAFTGRTLVNAGSLILDRNIRLGGDVYVNTAGATFGGCGGALDNNVTITNGGIFRVGGGVTSGTLTVGGTLALTDSGIAFNLYDNSESDTLLFGASGTAVLTGSTTIDFHPTTAATGTFFISNDKNLATAAITVDRQMIDATSRQEARWDTSGAGLDFVYGIDPSRVMTWTGAAGDTAWNSDGSANWTGSADKTKFLHGDAVIFNGMSGTIAIDSAEARVSSMEINNSATLTFAGFGISAAGAFATGTEVANAGLDTGRLIKHGNGELVFQNAANTFAGGIEVREGILAFTTAAQLGTGATAALTFAGGTLRPLAAATLAGSLQIGAAGGAIEVAAAQNLTLTGTTGGVGTLAKTGAGALVLSGTAPLGHAATRIDAGLIALRDITAAAAPAVSHTFVLKGGWLDLSDATYDSTGATANDWAGLTLAAGADSGGVIGFNDKLTLRAGDHAYDIGSATVAGLSGAASGTGIFVEIDAGPGGLATLSGVNNYAGHTVLRSGTLRVTADAQLGLAALNREIIFAAGGAAALELADGFATARPVELRADGEIAVATGAAATLAGPVSGAGVLAKTGAGTLVLTASTSRTGATVVQSGTLEGRAGSLRGDIAVNAGAALVFNPAGVEIFSGRITGAGDTVLASGELRAAAASVFSAAALHRVATGATLRLGGFSQTLGGLRNSGTVALGAPTGATGTRLTIHGDYHGDAGSALELNWHVDSAGALLTDLVEITGQSTGETRVNFTVPGGARNTLDAAGVDLANTRFLIAGDGAAGVFSGDYLINNLAYTLGLDADGNFTLLPADLSFPAGSVPAGLELAALFSGKAAGETLARRLAALRDWNAWGDGARPRARMNLWLDGIYRHDRISGTVRRGLKITTRGAQVGADYARGSADAFCALGFFADTIQGDLDAGTLPAESETHGFGVYGVWSARSGYIDLMFRAASDRYRAETSAAPALNQPVRNLDLSGHSLGAAVGAGRVLTAVGWRIEPRLQAAWWQTGAIRNNGAGAGGYDLRELRSITTGASVLVARAVPLGRSASLLPRLRLGVEQEIASDRTRAAGLGAGLSGATVAADLGLALRLGARFCISADASLYGGSSHNGYLINSGAGYTW